MDVTDAKFILTLGNLKKPNKQKTPTKQAPLLYSHRNSRTVRHLPVSSMTFIANQISGLCSISGRGKKRLIKKPFLRKTYWFSFSRRSYYLDFLKN